MDHRVKICGITQPEEIHFLDELGVSYAGLWHGIKGKYNLDIDSLTNLASIKTSSLEYILVTMQHDVDFLIQALATSTFHGIQLHGFQLPSAIKRIKNTFEHKIKIYKVLHVKDSKCLEEDLIDRYIDAGVDIFILDSYLDNQKIGSTGLPLKNDFIKSFNDAWQNKIDIMIAGGIDENLIGSVFSQHTPYGVDIDSAARENNLISRERVRRIMSFKKNLPALEGMPN